jgi:hypothetical protein
MLKAALGKAEIGKAIQGKPEIGKAESRNQPKQILKH